MKTIQLSDQAYTNLILFLNKTPLIGEEVPAYNDIMNCLANPLAEDNKVKQIK